MSLVDRLAAPAPRVSAPRRRSTAGVVAAFSATTFLSAFLLFSVQPLVAKLVLPVFGGSPAVWNTAMVFFQVALLAGYGYAHLVSRRDRSWQPFVHVALVMLAGLALPVALPLVDAGAAADRPVTTLLVALAAMAGAPFLAVSATGPLLQRWLASTDHPRAHDPYFLYATSNAGSFLGLLSYPLVLEPALSLDGQSGLWAAAYVVLVALLAIAATLTHLHRRPDAEQLAEAAGQPAVRPSAAARWRDRARWALLAFVPSSLLLGVTTYVTTDVAAVPLLWVVPLSLYLLTFVVAFGRSRAQPPGADLGRMVAPVALTLAVTMGLGFVLPAVPAAVVHLLGFALIALVAHARLALSRPEARRVTEFFLVVAVGGALGGALNALVAPVVFDSLAEYPLVLAVAVLALTPRRDVTGWGVDRSRAVVVAAAVPVVALLASEVAPLGGRIGVIVLAAVAVLLAPYAAPRAPAAFALAMVVATQFDPFGGEHVIRQERSFFGVDVVVDEGDRHVLHHGTTIHGWQLTDPGRALEPLSYYHAEGPLGDVFARYGEGFRDVAVVGLGTGTVAAHGRPGQRFTFYEIDPEIGRIAADASLFTYLRDARAEVRLVYGDGRLRMAEAPSATYDLIVLDAFTSDAVPVHVMTAEAVELYLDKLRPGGLLAFHVTNRHLDLAPVLGAIARDRALAGRVRTDVHSLADGEAPSEWVVLARETDDLDGLSEGSGWRLLPLDPGVAAWTDAYSNVLDVLRW